MGKKISLLKKRYLQEVHNQVQIRVRSSDVVDVLYNLVFGKVSLIHGQYFGGVTDDPTDPFQKRWRSMIREEIIKNLSKAVVVMSGTSIKVSFTLLSDEFVGVDTGGPKNANDPTPMRWLYFFIFGNFDKDLYWVPRSEVSKISNRSYSGRFREGYLLQATPGAIRELIKLTGADITRHPQSGQRGDPNLFQSLLTDQLVNDIIITPAITAATATIFPG